MDIVVVSESELRVGDATFRCAIGKGGIVAAEDKREGDLKTPKGNYPLRACYYRADKLDAPATGLPLIEIRADMGWCDDSSHPRYNQLVRLPFDASHENMWREDDCYDLVVTIGYNDDPIVAGAGSAIFLHIAKPNYPGTEGCVALAKFDVLQILAQLSPGSAIHILA